MWGPMWGGWGAPWGMFFMPLFFLVGLGCLFYFFRRGFPFCNCHSKSYNPNSNEQLVEEVRKLRQEVEELHKEIKK